MKNSHSNKYLLFATSIVILALLAVVFYKAVSKPPLAEDKLPSDSEAPIESIEENIKTALLDSGSTLSTNDDTKFGWTDSDSKYTYGLSPNVISLVAKAEVVEPTDIDNEPPYMYFANLRDKIKTIFINYGYSIDENNNSYGEGFSYIEGYFKDNTVCIVETLDFIQSSAPETVTYELSVNCSTLLADVKSEQTQFIEVLDPEMSSDFVRSVIQEGDYYRVFMGRYSGFLKKEDSKFRVITKGYEQLRCALVEAENIPYNLLKYSGKAECFEEDGATMRLLEPAS